MLVTKPRPINNHHLCVRSYVTIIRACKHFDRRILISCCVLLFTPCRVLGITEVLHRPLRGWKTLLSLTGDLRECSCLEDGCLCFKRFRSCLKPPWLKVKRGLSSSTLQLKKPRRTQGDHLWFEFETFPFHMHRSML